MGYSSNFKRKGLCNFFFLRVIFEVLIKKIDKFCLYLRDYYCYKIIGISKNMVI